MAKTYTVVNGIDIPKTKAAAKPGAWRDRPDEMARHEPGAGLTDADLKYAAKKWLLDKGHIVETGGGD